MAVADAEVKMYLDHVKVVVRGATHEALVAIAHQIEAETKVKIQENEQIDTGFMLNSTYVATNEGSGYGQARAAAQARNPDAKMAPEHRLSEDAVAVVVGAEYAIWQEARKSFLYAGAERVAGTTAGMTAERVYKRVVHD